MFAAEIRKRRVDPHEPLIKVPAPVRIPMTLNPASLTQPEKGLTTLTCPYHAWAWDLDGKLKAIPYFDGTKNGRNTDLDWSKYGLVPVRCAVWHHWIFVNMDGNAPPIEEHVASMAELMDGYDISATQVGHREDWAFKANWKLQNDNWEAYHHVWVHKCRPLSL